MSKELTKQEEDARVHLLRSIISGLQHEDAKRRSGTAMAAMTLSRAGVLDFSFIPFETRMVALGEITAHCHASIVQYRGFIEQARQDLASAMKLLNSALGELEGVAEIGVSFADTQQ